MSENNFQQIISWRHILVNVFFVRFGFIFGLITLFYFLSPFQTVRFFDKTVLLILGSLATFISGYLSYRSLPPSNILKLYLPRIARHSFVISMLWITLIQTSVLASTSFAVAYLPCVICAFISGCFLLSQNDIPESDRQNTPALGKSWFVLSGLIFIIIRILIVWKYGTPYLDEYLHLAAGKDFLNTGSFGAMYSTEGYTRGFYVTALIGSLLKLTSGNLPLTNIGFLVVSIVNFILFYKVLTASRASRFVTAISLILYTINSYSIFNHVYIRMFAFYELFFLLILLITVKLITAVQEKCRKQVIILTSIIAVINLFLISTKELENYLYIAISILSIGYAYLHTYADTLIQKASGAIKKILAASAIIIATLIIAIKSGLLDLFLHGKIPNGTGSVSSYQNFFLYSIALLSVLAMLGIVTLIIRRGHTRLSVYLFLVFYTLIAIHFTLSQDYQVIRGLLYLMPLFCLIATWSLELVFPRKKLVISLLLIGFLGIGSMKFFAQFPQIKGEINYFDYPQAYRFLNGCQQKYALIHSPFISDFYHVKLDGIFYIDQISLEENIMYRNVDGKYQLVYNDTPVVSSVDEFNRIISEQGACIITATDFRHSRLYIPEGLFKEMQQKTDPVFFEGLTVYKTRGTIN